MSPRHPGHESALGKDTSRVHESDGARNSACQCPLEPGNFQTFIFVLHRAFLEIVGLARSSSSRSCTIHEHEYCSGTFISRHIDGQLDFLEDVPTRISE
jgi:hypothetical protein